ncbi:hypothetical protein QF042_002532 [Pedobacter sp. W3I1]|nr:hypothetical protein [Pedobacter sp. W3I1]
MYEVETPSSLSFMYNPANRPGLIINVNYFVLVFDEDNKLTVDVPDNRVKLKTISNLGFENRGMQT